MNRTIFNSTFAFEYPKYTEFHADFKSVEIIGKQCTQKNLFRQNLLQVGTVPIEEDKLQYCTLFCQ